MITVACTRCEKSHDLPESYAGSTFLCPECGECLAVPDPEAAEASETEPAPTAITTQPSLPSPPKATIKRKPVSAIKRKAAEPPPPQEADNEEQPPAAKKNTDETQEVEDRDSSAEEDAAIEVHCEECDRTYRVPPKKAGGKIRCLGCGQMLDVPEEDVPTPEPDRSAKRKKPKASKRVKQETI
jgi:hypothetical protein